MRGATDNEGGGGAEVLLGVRLRGGWGGRLAGGTGGPYGSSTVARVPVPSRSGPGGSRTPGPADADARRLPG
ncbi:hypothetical protein [Streptomyces sp. NPDC021356]|uniref:hypothetical protein n=1 Tax=Streptomyces sp. NPDC021356 TaxID=3154900 RepID=UPI0033E26D46